MTRGGLVLAAHGSNEQPQVNHQIEQLADDIRERGLFAEVAVAFHQGTPQFANVLDRMHTSKVTVVPVMAADGYYARTVLPQELSKNRRFPDVDVSITPAVGTHRDMSSIACKRLKLLLTQFSISDANLRVAIVGHGTSRHPRSRETTLQLVQMLTAEMRIPNVSAVFLDDEPPIESLLDADQSGVSADLVVLPFLISPGPHMIQDVPRRLGMTSGDVIALPASVRVGGRRIVCDQPIGMDPAMVDVIVDLAMTCARRKGLRSNFTNAAGACTNKTLRLGSRGSILAMWQAKHVAALLAAWGIAVDIVAIKTSGDRDRSKAIRRLESASPFTDDIDRALLAGEIDLAVHSLKDLPTALPGGLVNAAVLCRGDAREALVSRGDVSLHALPTAARVGTSSPRRCAQLLSLRPDLVPAVIRGPVDDRIAQVCKGAFDAVVLAMAGLERLGLTDQVGECFPVDTFLPAPAQGALVIQTRADARDVRAIVAALNHPETHTATDIELAVLRAFESQDGVVVAAHAICGRRIRLHARLLSLDGRRVRELVLEDGDAQSLTLRAIHALRTAWADQAEHAA